MNSILQGRKDLLRILDTALSAVNGDRAVADALAARPIEGRVVCIAIGKAAQSMMRGAQSALGDALVGGLVISKAGHLDAPWLADHGLDGIEGGHPLPTKGSLEAGRRLVERLASGGDETLLFLISGGASSLLEAPVAGVGLDELEQANTWLLGSGLDIHAMNLVRKSLSSIKGGGLLSRLSGRNVRAMAISDVPGDAPAVIGSGLLVPDPGLREGVNRLELPDWLDRWVKMGLAERTDTIDHGPPVDIIASLDRAKAAAGKKALKLGYPTWIHDRFVADNVAVAAGRMADTLLSSPAGLHIWGGEPSVVLPSEPGRGGRNQHLALTVARAIAGREDCLFLSIGTDGTDGPTDDAGGLVDGFTLERLETEGFDAADALARFDAGPALEASGDLIQTGPTGTNVMDLMFGLKLDGKLT